MSTFALHEDRFFDPDPAIRARGARLYEETRDAPARLPARPRRSARSSPTTSRSPSRPRSSSSRITTSSGCSTRAASRWNRSASRPATAPRSSATRGRSGSASPSTTTCSAARRPALWLDDELHELFGVRGSSTARPRRRSTTRSPRSCEPGVPPARAVRPVQHRGAGDDRQGERPARAPRGASAVRVDRPRDPDLPPRRGVPHRQRRRGATRSRSLERGVGARSPISPRSSARSRSAGASSRRMGATATDHAVRPPVHRAVSRRRGGRAVPARAPRRGDARGPAPLRGAHADGDGAACPSRTASSCSCTPAPSATTTAGVRALRDRQGRRHPDRDRVHAQPRGAAQRLRQRPAPHAGALHPRRDRPTRASSRRSPATTRRSGSARPGGSTTRSRGCAASASRRPRRPGSRTPPASTTTRAPSARSRRATTSPGGWTRTISPGWWRGTSSTWTMHGSWRRALAYDLVRETYRLGGAGSLTTSGRRRGWEWV